MVKSLFILLPVLVAISLVYLPRFWVNIFVLVDFYTPWVLFESSLYDKYHHFLVDNLPVKPDIPLLEITKEEANYDNLYKLSNGFTFPIIIRGLFAIVLNA